MIIHKGFKSIQILGETKGECDALLNLASKAHLYLKDLGTLSILLGIDGELPEVVLTDGVFTITKKTTLFKEGDPDD